MVGVVTIELIARSLPLDSTALSPDFQPTVLPTSFQSETAHRGQRTVAA